MYDRICNLGTNHWLLAEFADGRERATVRKFIKPSGIYSAADLMRFVPKEREKLYLTGSEEIYTHIEGRKIFGGAMKFSTTETNKLKQLDDERA